MITRTDKRVYLPVLFAVAVAVVVLVIEPQHSKSKYYTQHWLFLENYRTASKWNFDALKKVLGPFNAATFTINLADSHENTIVRAEANRAVLEVVDGICTRWYRTIGMNHAWNDDDVDDLLECEKRAVIFNSRQG